MISAGHHTQNQDQKLHIGTVFRPESASQMGIRCTTRNRRRPAGIGIPTVRVSATSTAPTGPTRFPTTRTSVAPTCPRAGQPKINADARCPDRRNLPAHGDTLHLVGREHPVALRRLPVDRSGRGQRLGALRAAGRGHGDRRSPHLLSPPRLAADADPDLRLVPDVRHRLAACLPALSRLVSTRRTRPPHGSNFGIRSTRARSSTEPARPASACRSGRELGRQDRGRLGERRTVPGQMPPRHQRERDPRKRLGPVVCGEGVRLVG